MPTSGGCEQAWEKNIRTLRVEVSPVLAMETLRLSQGVSRTPGSHMPGAALARTQRHLLPLPAPRSHRFTSSPQKGLYFPLLPPSKVFQALLNRANQPSGFQWDPPSTPPLPGLGAPWCLPDPFNATCSDLVWISPSPFWLHIPWPQKGLVLCLCVLCNGAPFLVRCRC